ncbi:MAG: hypothetical protein HC887_11960 [Desulfobacteraceae bacterium]|nr:hypothetical protein [Desulfobacteraceae bacterium]
MAGYGEIRQTLLAPSFLGEHAELIKDFPYQPETAKKILNGKKVSLTLVSGFPNANVHGSLPEIIQSQLKNIGIEINIIKVSDVGLYHAMRKEHKGDLWLEKGNNNSADLTFLPHLLFHPKGFYPGQLHTVSGSEQFCQFIEKARNIHEAGQIGKYTALALQEIIHNEILFIPIAELPFMMAAQANIKVSVLYPTLLTTQWRGFGKIKSFFGQQTQIHLSG